MMTSSKLVQLAKALSPMLVTELGKVMVFKPEYLNASLPILVTELGMVSVSKLVHLQKAPSPIRVIVLGNFTVVIE